MTPKNNMVEQERDKMKWEEQKRQKLEQQKSMQWMKHTQL